MEIVKDEPNSKQETPVATYDPSKKYTWKREENFSLSGADFGIVLNALRAILSTSEAQKILLAKSAHDVIENLMATGVEKGIVTEVK